MLLSSIKGLIFVFKSSTEYNTDLIYHKKGRWTKFLFYIHVLRFQQQLLLTKLLDQLFSLQSRKQVSHSQGTFPQSRNFFTVKELFQSRNFFTVKELVRSQGTSSKSRNFSTIKETFHSCRDFPQSKRFSKS